jgi:hypothetical protein
VIQSRGDVCVHLFLFPSFAIKRPNPSDNLSLLSAGNVKVQNFAFFVCLFLRTPYKKDE